MKSPANSIRTRCRSGFNLTWVLILVLGMGFYSELQGDEGLPLLGENAAINIEQERQLGAQFYRHLVARGLVVTSPILHQYLNELGARLLSGIENRARNYTFFIVKDMGVNAFAVPGGFIGVNIGLITRAQNQDQLASVLAHEIAHVRLMHSLQSMQKSSEVSTASMLGMLAGLVLGGVNSELGSALIFGSTAGSQQAMINFTRENEYEADRLGMELLQKGNFNPQGMVDFFKLMQRIAGSSEFQNIEYLRTHPVHANRISEAQNRVKLMAMGKLHPDYFLMFRDYLEYFSSDRPVQLGSSFRGALGQIKGGQFELADRTLRRLYQQDSENIWYGYAFAENLEYLDRLDQAEQVYRELLEIFPDEFAFSLRLIRLLKSASEFESALVIARRLEKRYPNSKTVYIELAGIYGQLNRPVFRMLAEAEYHRLAGNPALAIKLYNRVIDSAETDLATASKARAKRDEISQPK
jgi:predicted Zn-dependent protease